MPSRIFPFDLSVYALVFTVVFCALVLFPPAAGYIWEPLTVNVLTALLFTLLVALTARLIGTDRRLMGLGLTALFLIFFCPGAERFFCRDEAALMELGSQCIVPFFIMQYMNVSRKNFRKWYVLMMLMGVFCSMTHNGITIPLCVTFVWMSFLHRKQFFRRACWPMVVGFVVGTLVSLWLWYASLNELDAEPLTISSRANEVFHTLWDTKVLLFSLGLTLYLLSTHEGRRMLLWVGRRHYVISFCVLVSWVALPFAPLGLGNAITGVCFFSMLWALCIAKYTFLR